MDPNSQTPQPSETPKTDVIPDGKEPDTSGVQDSKADITTVDGANDIPTATEQTSDVSSSSDTTPLPSSSSVVNPTTPMSVSTSGVGPAPAKTKNRLILIIVLVAIIVVAAGVIFYVSTMG